VFEGYWGKTSCENDQKIIDLVFILNR
jgi:hypothetical protein